MSCNEWAFNSICAAKSLCIESRYGASLPAVKMWKRYCFNVSHKTSQKIYHCLLCHVMPTGICFWILGRAWTWNCVAYIFSFWTCHHLAYSLITRLPTWQYTPETSQVVLFSFFSPYIKGIRPCKKKLLSVYLIYRKYLIHRTKLENISFQKCLDQKIKSFQVSSIFIRTSKIIRHTVSPRSER